MFILKWIRLYTLSSAANIGRLVTIYDSADFSGYTMRWEVRIHSVTEIVFNLCWDISSSASVCYCDFVNLTNSLWDRYLIVACFWMKLFKLIALISLLANVSTANADTTWGIGGGPLYNGFGLNFGKTTTSSFVYGAFGCHGYGRGESDNPSSNDVEFNCGIGFGYISTSMFATSRHGIGLGLDTTYNTFQSQFEMRLRPGYYYFFNGINKSGLNLGVGPSFYYDTVRSNDHYHNPVKVFFNIGYQF